jgi:RNA polymerase sigma-70 factor (ECF subfamily)
MPGDVREEFVADLLAAQRAVYAYILSLIPTRNDADDLLQQTNTVLLRKAAEYPEIDNFVGWACRVAYYEVLAHRAKMNRDKLLFDDELVEILAVEATQMVTGVDRRREALRQCVEQLPEPRRRLVMQRYASSLSVGAIAEQMGRPVGSIYQTLHRIRNRLLDCVERRLATDN